MVMMDVSSFIVIRMIFNFVIYIFYTVKWPITFMYIFPLNIGVCVRLWGGSILGNNLWTHETQETNFRFSKYSGGTGKG